MYIECGGEGEIRFLWLLGPLTPVLRGFQAA